MRIPQISVCFAGEKQSYHDFSITINIAAIVIYRTSLPDSLGDTQPSHRRGGDHRTKGRVRPSIAAATWACRRTVRWRWTSVVVSARLCSNAGHRVAENRSRPRVRDWRDVARPSRRAMAFAGSCWNRGQGAGCTNGNKKRDFFKNKNKNTFRCLEKSPYT